MKSIMWLSNLLLGLLGMLNTGKAQVSLPAIFSDNMILQRDKTVSVWGTAKAGEEVVVSFNGQVKKTIAGNDNAWRIVLAPMPASAQGREMKVAASNMIVYKNIIIGDIWLCSGQSNMEYPMDKSLKKYMPPANGIDSAEWELNQPKTSEVRYLHIERPNNKKRILTNGWVTGDDSTVRYISAIGYYFAKEIHTEIGVPVGIISSSVGGSRIEQWTPPEVYKGSPLFAKHDTAAEFKIDGMEPGKLYAGMIAPLVPYALKGVLWYQGESNCIIKDQRTYPEKFKLLTERWRSDFADGELPFYYVQVAPYLYSKRDANDTQKDAGILPAFWEAQSKGLAINHTGMAVVTDLVDKLSNIHPSYKWAVGHRLALIAMANAYGKKMLEYSGPVFKNLEVSKDKLIVNFSHADYGFKIPADNNYTWFEIAGEDGKFVPAIAVPQGNKMVVSAIEIKAPKYVRFAWSERAQPNFFNAEGLPAVPFRSDSF